MKYLLCIIFFCFLFSCEEEVYFDIPMNEKPLLKDSDTIYFESNVNHEIDTFIIKLSDEYMVSDNRYYHERIYIRYQKLNTFSSFKSFFIQQGESTAISVDGNYFPAIYDNEKIVNYILNGINYKVYLLHDTNFPDSIPKSIYYSQQYRILRYDFIDNNYYELKNY